ncbi:Concanavalin A-like lectin/glucanase [Cordyceps fumosorosea ARSEF 2679]|uniref:Concanavalin A-like lectin/glucanase n=1 Tax=Cordyceps fumosorosea (strain ARSEF 2679) TaxID=1081104 RepID=A0A167PME2_CORFA|nr:Concanavalin A-like lectin/glucanase [Cordyceps fumosorosea ARSEF 2679]OAA56816.1 Concanavalin A-like lectin/glucanase [Cordyceps fumosorosea ARSEF 2679]
MFTKLVSGLAALSSVAQALPNPTAPSSLEARTQVSSNVWCGPVLAASAKQASAEWVVPQVSMPSSSNGDDIEFYQWVGIDGYHAGSCPNALLQVGTAERYINNDWVYTVWLEYYTPDNTSSWHFNDPAVKAGDSSASWPLQATGDYPLCYEHVEWVNEAPTKNLPTFPAMTFTSLSYTDWNGNTYNAAGSDLQYLNQQYAVCSSTLSSDGSTAYFTEAPPSSS